MGHFYLVIRRPFAAVLAVAIAFAVLWSWVTTTGPGLAVLIALGIATDIGLILTVVFRKSHYLLSAVSYLLAAGTLGNVWSVLNATGGSRILFLIGIVGAILAAVIAVLLHAEARATQSFDRL